MYILIILHRFFVSSYVRQIIPVPCVNANIQVSLAFSLFVALSSLSFLVPMPLEVDLPAVDIGKYIYFRDAIE